MMKHRWLMSGCLVVSFVAVVFMTGCENGNLFGSLHDSGSGDIGSLSSDAANALRDKNYSQALQIYEQILAQDSDNAEALYGAAAAAVGSSGLNFGQLLSNILSQQGSPSISGLGDFIHAAQEGPTSQQAGTDSLLAGVNLTALDSVIDTAICRLQRIVSGASDGSINPNDISVILDFGSLCLVRAVLRPIQADFFDIINNNGSYEISPSVDFNTFCGVPGNQAIIEGVGRDLAGAYALFNRAVTLLNLSGNQIILQLRDDINTAATILLTPAGPNALPAACLTILNNIGINLSTFQTQTGAFQAPSGC